MDIDRFKKTVENMELCSKWGIQDIRFFVNKSRDRVCVWLACIDGGIQ